MNYQELKNKLIEIGETETAIETVVFDDLSSINTNRQKKYPVLLVKPSNSITNNFSITSNTQQLDEYIIEFYALTSWNNEEKKTIPLEQRYKEMIEIGDNFIRSFLEDGGNEYYLFGNKTITRTNGHHQHVDQLVGTKFSFTLRVSNIDNCEI